MTGVFFGWLEEWSHQHTALTHNISSLLIAVTFYVVGQAFGDTRKHGKGCAVLDYKEVAVLAVLKLIQAMISKVVPVHTCTLYTNFSLTTTFDLSLDHRIFNTLGSIPCLMGCHRFGFEAHKIHASQSILLHF